MRFDYKCKTCGYHGEHEVRTSGEEVYCPHCDQEGMGNNLMSKSLMDLVLEAHQDGQVMVSQK